MMDDRGSAFVVVLVLVLDTPSHHGYISSFFDYEDDDEDDWNKPVPRNPQRVTRHRALINRTISSTASRMPVIRALEIML